MKTKQTRQPRKWARSPKTIALEEKIKSLVPADYFRLVTNEEQVRVHHVAKAMRRRTEWPFQLVTSKRKDGQILVMALQCNS